MYDLRRQLSPTNTDKNNSHRSYTDILYADDRWPFAPCFGSACHTISRLSCRVSGLSTPGYLTQQEHKYSSSRSCASVVANIRHGTLRWTTNRRPGECSCCCSCVDRRTRDRRPRDVCGSGNTDPPTCMNISESHCVRVCLSQCSAWI